jgi:hypothetical protein
MGYTVYARAKDKEKQEKMYAFLENNFKNYCEVVLADINITGIRLAMGTHEDGMDGLAYATGKNTVGFDYQSGTFGLEKFYVTEIAKWISKKIGDRKNYYYDSEKMVINDSFASKDYMELLQNDCKYTGRKDLFDRSIEFIKGEIDRLDKLWMEGEQCQQNSEKTN